MLSLEQCWPWRYRHVFNPTAALACQAISARTWRSSPQPVGLANPPPQPWILDQTCSKSLKLDSQELLLHNEMCVPSTKKMPLPCRGKQSLPTAISTSEHSFDIIRYSVDCDPTCSSN